MCSDTVRRRSMASVRRGHSSSVSLPVRRLPWLTRPMEPTIRTASWAAPISIEKMATGRPSLSATCSAMFMANEVLPIEGAPPAPPVAGLQARGHAVQVVEAGGHAGDVHGVVGHLLDAVQQVDHQRIQRLEALLVARALLADLEDLLLGLVEDALDRLPCGLKALVAISSLALTSLRRMARSRTISHSGGCCWHWAHTAPAVQVGQAAHLLGLAQVLQAARRR
jgi:hypothetical protein